MRTKHIDIHQTFLRYMVEDKEIANKYMRIEENPADMTTNNCSEPVQVNHTKRTTEGELWELLETGMKNDNNNGVLDGVMDCDLTEYSSHALVNPVEKTNRCE